jgi:hypothetical protein
MLSEALKSNRMKIPAPAENLWVHRDVRGPSWWEKAEERTARIVRPERERVGRQQRMTNQG